MLNCHVDPHWISTQCGSCNKCLGRSKLDYPFSRDLFNSDDLVAAIIAFVAKTTGYRCVRTTIHKNPDINVLDSNNNIICRIESKYLEGQAFMKSRQYIGLDPREALVVDKPKLLSYFECKETDRVNGRNVPIFIVWKYDRPCDDIGGITVFQEIDVLREIYYKFGSQRAFERKASFNDFQNGSKLGITEKYHYSIRECEPVENLPSWILSL